MTFPTLTLDEFLTRRWQAQPFSEASALSAVVSADSKRAWERQLLRWLPGSVVRRLDRGFARSNTVHPETGKAGLFDRSAMRPRIVLETGTYWGYSTAYLAAGVTDNGTGHVVSLDLHQHAGKHLPKAFKPVVTLHRGKPSTESLPAVLAKGCPDLFFQDSIHDRDGILAELKLVVPTLDRDAVVLFHDFVVPGVREAATAGLPGWSIFQLQNNDPQQVGVAVQWL